MCLPTTSELVVLGPGDRDEEQREHSQMEFYASSEFCHMREAAKRDLRPI